MLIKNAEALEVLEKVDTLVVDKTGTLTEGKPRLMSVVPLRRASTKATCCASAPSLERASEHPLAAAIVAGAQERELELAAVNELPLDHRQGRHRRRSTAARSRWATAG